jgi:hypothetical protein
VTTEHTTAPKVVDREAEYLGDEEAQHIIKLLVNEDDVRVKTAI